MGAVKYDLEEITSNKADEIAEQRYGRPFSELPAPLQMQVWMEAENEAADQLASELDATYDRLREDYLLARGNGHKTKEEREAFWAELELQRRLGK